MSRFKLPVSLSLAVVLSLALPLMAGASSGQWEKIGDAKNQSPYYVPYKSLTREFIASAPTLARGRYGDLKSGTRLPINTAPEGDFAKLAWPAWRFGNFYVDGLLQIVDLYKPTREDFRVVPYRPLPRLTDRPAVPYGSYMFDYGKLNIPVLNYSPDMVAGFPCDLFSTLGGENPANSLYRPKVWLEASGGRAAGAALVPSDPCVTQRAIDLAVYALSHASPDRSMRDFMAGLEHIRKYADRQRYGVSDILRLYRDVVEGKDSVFWGIFNPLHGGNLFFLAPGHEGKRLYWLLLHPPGDARLFPIGYLGDDDLIGVRRSNPPIAAYWRPRLIGGGLSDIVPDVGRVGIRFALYSPDNALVCGRDLGYDDFVVGEGNRVSERTKRMSDYSHARCEFALSPHMRTGGTHFITAVVYLVWEPQQNTWVFDDMAIGSSLWSSTAGIDRYSQVVPRITYIQAPLLPGMLLQRLLPAYSAIGQ